jgi:hypothetical protein
MNIDHDEIWRDEQKEHRGSNFVTYQPADSPTSFACVDLVFHEKIPAFGEIRRSMEQEMKLWLTRFPVPVIISSFDATGSFIHLPEDDGGSTLMAYIDPQTGVITKRWGLFEKSEMPMYQMTAEYFTEVYRGVPFRRAQAVREAVEIEHRKQLVGFRIQCCKCVISHV